MRVICRVSGKKVPLLIEFLVKFRVLIKCFHKNVLVVSNYPTYCIYTIFTAKIHKKYIR